MNDAKRTLTLAWLMQHASLGELPEHLDDECRDYAVNFISAAMSELRRHRDPVVLAAITIGMVEGEFHVAD